jgi:hypothetical protein
MNYPKFSISSRSRLTQIFRFSIALSAMALFSADLAQAAPLTPSIGPSAPQQPMPFPKPDTLRPKHNISGEVVVELAYQYQDRRCQDLAVSLTSIERYPAPPSDGPIRLTGNPLFNYSQSLSGDIKTGKCNYSITAFTIDAGKQATLTVNGGGDTATMRPLRTVTIPSSQPVKMNLNVVFSRIN